jgi:hypothetical protein
MDLAQIYVGMYLQTRRYVHLILMWVEQNSTLKTRPCLDGSGKGTFQSYSSRINKVYYILFLHLISRVR